MDVLGDTVWIQFLCRGVILFIEYTLAFFLEYPQGPDRHLRMYVHIGCSICKYLMLCNVSCCHHFKIRFCLCMFKQVVKEF